LSDELEGHSSIVRRIIDGSLTIDSAGEFENLLKVFPNDPGLHRAFADFLARKKSFDAAADSYRTAARLFVEAGMGLQAIVSKISEWRIVRPSHQEGTAFHEALRKGISRDTPVQDFLIKMTYPEMVAFMARLVRVRFRASQMVQKFGSMQKNLCFVVSGALKETIYHPLQEGEKVQQKSTTDLVENDFFGDIYPFEEARIAQSDVETITRVELVKISKPRVQVVCEKYPHVERLVDELYKTRSEAGGEIDSQTIRKAARHQLPTKVSMKVFREEIGKTPLFLNGFTDDISLGGACVILGATYETGPSAEMVGRNVKIELGLPSAAAKLHILGTIVWSKEVSDEGKTITVVGVQFKEMTDPDREVLEGYCHGSDGEQNLIWSLWESLVRQ
jgi:CRP-like cAMP-binding protein